MNSTERVCHPPRHTVHMGVMVCTPPTLSSSTATMYCPVPPHLERRVHRGRRRLGKIPDAEVAVRGARCQQVGAEAVELEALDLRGGGGGMGCDREGGG